MNPTQDDIERIPLWLTAENRAHRDLADYGSTVSNIARSIRNAGIRIRTVHEFGDPMPADVLPDLRQAQADLAALIAELEGVA